MLQTRSRVKGQEPHGAPRIICEQPAIFLGIEFVCENHPLPANVGAVVHPLFIDSPCRSWVPHDDKLRTVESRQLLDKRGAPICPVRLSLMIWYKVKFGQFRCDQWIHHDKQAKGLSDGKVPNL